MNGYPPDWLQPWLFAILAVLTVAALGGLAVMIGGTVRDIRLARKIRRIGRRR